MSEARRATRLLTAASCALLLAACGSGQEDVDMSGMEAGGSDEAEQQQVAFSGTVQTIDTVTGIVSVANEDIPGWMMAMTMNYYVEPSEVIGSLEPGDRITATVYSGDFQHLYEVEVVGDP